jgi:hypothetical protein
MNDITVGNLVGTIQWTHNRILALTQELSDGQFAQQASPTAPPIGWHVFHIGRWADRLQASIPKTRGQKSDLRKEIWVVNNLAKHWDEKLDNLGWLETGTGMDIESAVYLAAIGKSTLLDYAQHTFDEANLAVGELKVEQLQQTRLSIRPEYRTSSTGQLQIDYAGDRPVTVLDDLLFHISHASRHLGMIEALRGVLFTIVGTATV